MNKYLCLCGSLNSIKLATNESLRKEKCPFCRNSLAEGESHHCEKMELGSINQGKNSNISSASRAKFGNRVKGYEMMFEAPSETSTKSKTNRGNSNNNINENENNTQNNMNKRERKILANATKYEESKEMTEDRDLPDIDEMLIYKQMTEEDLNENKHYLLDDRWLGEWKAYINKESEVPPYVGINKYLISNDIRNQQIGKYSRINPNIWDYLYKKYKGGYICEVFNNHLDIQPDPNFSLSHNPPVINRKQPKNILNNNNIPDEVNTLKAKTCKPSRKLSEIQKELPDIRQAIRRKSGGDGYQKNGAKSVDEMNERETAKISKDIETFGHQSKIKKTYSINKEHTELINLSDPVSWKLKKNKYTDFVGVKGNNSKLTNISADPSTSSYESSDDSSSSPQSSSEDEEGKADVVEYQNTIESVKQRPFGNKQSLFGNVMVGLVNSSFYCYMNASLQCLMSIPELVDYYLAEEYKLIKFKPKKLGFKTSSQFELFLKSCWKTKKKTVDPFCIQKLVYRIFQPGTQQDAHEFMRYILCQLQEETSPYNVPTRPENLGDEDSWKFYVKYHPSIIDFIFAGQYESSVICDKCRHVSITFDPFLDMNLPLQSKTFTKFTLQKSIHNFFQKESLSLKGGYKCDKCKRKTKANKVLRISRAPRILVIQLKRFSSFPHTKKITGFVNYPSILDISPYTQNKESCKYTLQAICIHKGSANAGHYIALGKRADKWVLFNDMSVRPCSEKDALGNEAYVLFYSIQTVL